MLQHMALEAEARAMTAVKYGVREGWEQLWSITIALKPQKSLRWEDLRAGRFDLVKILAKYGQDVTIRELPQLQFQP